MNDTYLLESAKVKTSQDMERKSEMYSLAREGIQRSRLLRTHNKGKPARRTYFLERVEVKAGWDTERKQSSQKNLQTRGSRGLDWLGYGKRAS